MNKKIIIAIISLILAGSIGFGIYYGVSHKNKIETIDNSTYIETTAGEWVENYDFDESFAEKDLNSYKEHSLPPVTLN